MNRSLKPLCADIGRNLSRRRDCSLKTKHSFSNIGNKIVKEAMKSFFESCFKFERHSFPCSQHQLLNPFALSTSRSFHDHTMTVLFDRSSKRSSHAKLLPMLWPMDHHRRSKPFFESCLKTVSLLRERCKHCRKQHFNTGKAYMKLMHRDDLSKNHLLRTVISSRRGKCSRPSGSQQTPAR